jgi:hypothetical protein
MPNFLTVYLNISIPQQESLRPTNQYTRYPNAKSKKDRQYNDHKGQRSQDRQYNDQKGHTIIKKTLKIEQQEPY